MAIEVNARKSWFSHLFSKKKYILVISNMCVGLPAVRVCKFDDLDRTLNALRDRHDLDKIDIERLFRDGLLKKFYRDASVTYQFNIVEV